MKFKILEKRTPKKFQSPKSKTRKSRSDTMSRKKSKRIKKQIQISNFKTDK